MLGASPSRASDRPILKPASSDDDDDAGYSGIQERVAGSFVVKEVGVVGRNLGLVRVGWSVRNGVVQRFSKRWGCFQGWFGECVVMQWGEERGEMR